MNRRIYWLPSGRAWTLPPISPTPALQCISRRTTNVFARLSSVDAEDTVLQQAELAPGREVRSGEEPLVVRCLQRNVPLEGKRELSLGKFAGVRVYPVQDRRGKCFAAVVFDLSGVEDVFINVAFEFLKTPARQEGASEFYERLAPGDGLMVVDADKNHRCQLHRAAYFSGCRRNKPCRAAHQQCAD